MTPVLNLPGEIICDIFSLTIQNSRIFPDVFKSGNTFQDCVSLIDISLICRKWREIALTNPTLWSSILIHSDNPTAESLRQVTHFANICFTRSKYLPLTIVITLTNIFEIRFAHPLMHAVISHENRWSRIAINIIPHPVSPESPAIIGEEGSTGVQALSLGNARSSNLREFHFNLGSLFTYSMTEPLPALESLKITCYKLNGCLYTLTKWLPLSLNLQEFECTAHYDRFVAWTVKQNEQAWLTAARDARARPHFILPTLRTLNVWAPLIPYLTCPVLEKYVMDMISWRPQDLTDFLEFIERSSPPLRTIEVKRGHSFMDIPSVRGYFLLNVTNLLVTAPDYTFFDMFSDRSADGLGFLLLPGLEHLEITACDGCYRQDLSILIASRWNIGASRRALRSVKLRECFKLSPIPELLLSPPSDGIDLTRVEGKWREIARCVNEGLLLSICE
ncbi:hypothetical protein SCHPADRAFT_944210 [Schizopora paradoxa]|uniref:F-box domain-containing protein n=1 Tax=Schizopora paradoxa TaxID=27342 RepID=A0A0H2RV67_9AGAM|nr:hypothetical protein SCHPADRAFT_944210 [Schizopora paradoxa]